MHSDVDGSGEKSFFDFFGEKTLAFNFVEAEVLDGVAFGFDDFDDRSYTCISKLLLHKMCLPESQVATARANDNGIFQSEKFVRK